VAASSQQGDGWTWLRDGTAVPAPDALDRLLEALGRLDGLPAPVLLVSKVVDRAGALVPSLAPWYLRDDAALAMDAAGRGLLPVRAARTSSVLVRADALERLPRRGRGLPPAAAGLEWTARLLRDAPGYLVPASVAVAAAEAPEGPVEALDADPRRDLLAAGALLAGSAFGAREKARIALEVSSRALGAGRRGRRGRAPRGSRG
jgi:hypothetical protein